MTRTISHKAFSLLYLKLLPFLPFQALESPGLPSYVVATWGRLLLSSNVREACASLPFSKQWADKVRHKMSVLQCSKFTCTKSVWNGRFCHILSLTYNYACVCLFICLNLYVYAGKSTLLTSISERDLPIPDHIDIFHLTEEIRASDKTPLQCVMEVDDERWVLE